ncbi:MAG: hypothetical protein JSS10_03625 [Verrucomicrobia bacterium]|nr:hypothetical protein [Verrucomicrobiota bacterium]
MSIYSKNRYMSYDLDYVTFEDKQKIKKSLARLGFFEKQKHFAHPECPFLIEFVTPPVAVGKEFVHQFRHLSTPLGSLKLLREEDCVKDRLASYYHWNDKQALIQAVEVCLACKIDFEELKSWSEEEGFSKKFTEFLEAYKISSKK